MAVKMVVASGKGGVGKSTVTAFLGLALAKRNKRVLLIDTDVALNSLDVMLGVRDKVSLSWLDVIDGKCSPDEAFTPVRDNLTILAAPTLPVGKGRAKPDDFAKMVVECENDFDYILIDAPAGLGEGLARAATAATRALVIATPDEISVKAANSVSRVLHSCAVRQSRLVINRFEAKVVKKGERYNIDEVIDLTEVRLIGIIPEDANISFSSFAGRPKKEKSIALDAFDRLAGRLEGQNISLNLKKLK